MKIQVNNMYHYNLIYFIDHGFHFFQKSPGLISESGTKLWRKLLMRKNENGRKQGQSMLYLVVLDSPTLSSVSVTLCWKLRFYQYSLISIVAFFSRNVSTVHSSYILFSLVWGSLPLEHPALLLGGNGGLTNCFAQANLELWSSPSLLAK
jgi:hypothetical protein